MIRERRFPHGSRVPGQGVLAVVLALGSGVGGAELDLRRLFQEGIPESPYAGAVYAYADAMLKSAAADPDEAGLHRDQNLLRLLFFLEGLSGEKRYPAAAEDALRVLFGKGNAQTAERMLRDRPWLLWDRCFAVAPQECIRYALALSPGPSLRHAGFAVRTWAEAFRHTKDERFLASIQSTLDRSGLERGGTEAEILSCAIDCDGAARLVPEPLRTRLSRFAASCDGAAGRLPAAELPLWEGRHTRALLAVMCVSRYENTGALAFRNRFMGAADAYLHSLPDASSDAWPLTFGLAISLELAAFRTTARAVYLQRARTLGDVAIERFFGPHPLPRASLRSDHYDAATGGSTLILALCELHLCVRHITAVRAPANTVDR